jgi:hypothetical protein
MGIHRDKVRQHGQRITARERRREHGLVVASRIRTRYDASRIRRDFGLVLEGVEVEPGRVDLRELHHSFVSLRSDDCAARSDLSPGRSSTAAQQHSSTAAQQ